MSGQESRKTKRSEQQPEEQPEKQPEKQPEQQPKRRKMTKPNPINEVEKLIAKMYGQNGRGDLCHGECPVVKTPPVAEASLSELESLSRDGKIPKVPTLKECNGNMLWFLSAMEIYEEHHGGFVEGVICHKHLKRTSRVSGLTIHIPDSIVHAYRNREENGQSPVGSPIESPM